jgi:hypothetical protein
VNEEQRLEFVDMWNAELDQIESLDITAWLRAYSQIHIKNNPGPAMELVARIDDKIRIAADTIEQLTKQRDEARREVCNWSVGVGLKATSQAVAEERGWDCYEKETP